MLNEQFRSHGSERSQTNWISPCSDDDDDEDPTRAAARSAASKGARAPVVVGATGEGATLPQRLRATLDKLPPANGAVLAALARMLTKVCQKIAGLGWYDFRL